MYNKSGLRKVIEFNNFWTSMFSYINPHKQLPYLFHDFSVYNYEIHDYETRNTHGLHIPQCRTNPSQSGNRYRGAIVWNRLIKTKINQGTSKFFFYVEYYVITRAAVNAEIPSAAVLRLWNSRDHETVQVYKYAQRMEAMKQSDLWSSLCTYGSVVVIWWLCISNSGETFRPF